MVRFHRDAPAWQQLLVAVFTVGALVGMHHLTAAGCSAIAEAHQEIHAGITLERAGPSPVDSAAPELPPGGSAELICLAIAVAFIFLRPLWRHFIVASQVRRSLYRGFTLVVRDPDPPDLFALSKSRT